jgi:hypothetical protein
MFPFPPPPFNLQLTYLYLHPQFAFHLIIITWPVEPKLYLILTSARPGDHSAININTIVITLVHHPDSGHSDIPLTHAAHGPTTDASH